MSPTVSVIVPTFNRANLIGAAIESVLQQTFTDYEIVVVDDGSTDDTAAVVARCGGPVRYIKVPHQGVAHARNVGFTHAAGRYWTFLDSDDLLYPYALELGTRVLDRFRDVAAVFSEMSAFDDAGFFERYHLRTYHQSSFRDSSLSYERIFASSLSLDDAGLRLGHASDGGGSDENRRAYFGNIFSAYLDNLVMAQNTALMRREAVQAVGSVDERIRHWDFVDLLLRFVRKFPVAYVDVPTYKVRYHDDQMSRTPYHSGHAIWLLKQRWLLRVVCRNAHSDPGYYALHRSAIDRRVADLHRAVAVPLLLTDTPAARSFGYERRARVHLRQCDALGYPQHALWFSSFLPGHARRLVVTLLQHARRVVRRLKAGGRRAAWITVGAWMALVVLVLVAEDLGANALNTALLYLPGIDKVLHVLQSAAIFCVFALLLRRTKLPLAGQLGIAVAGTLAAAVFDEVQQQFAGGRTVELADIEAATAGTLVALGMLQMRRRPKLAMPIVTIGIVGALGITQASYLRTRDYNRGLLAERDGRPADALRHYQDAVASGAQNPDAYNALAWTITQSQGGDVKAAVGYAEQSLALRPGDPDTLDTYGWALYRAGRAHDAVQPLEQAFSAKPTIYCIHYHLAVVYLALGRREDGIRHLRDQVKLMPRTKEAQLSADLLARLAPGDPQ